MGAVLQVGAATLVVDATGGAPYATIQSAIDAAVPGQDDVLVRCGTYAENILMKDGVSVRGSGAACTTIDGRRLGSVVRFPELQSSTELSGFTVRGGSGHGTSAGYGIEMRSAGAPVITRNVVEGNFASGIAAYSWTTVVGLEPFITQNVIRNNQACCSGGGILLVGHADATVTSNLIVGNSAGYGGGIYVAGKAQIAHNTVVENEAGLGGGVFALGVPDTSPTLVSNVIVENEASWGGGVANYLTEGMEFSGNDVWGNVGGDYAPPNGENPALLNASVDPLFVDRAENFAGFQLRSMSPLREGRETGFGPPDLYGLPRPLDADVDGVSRIDLGARENDGPTRLRCEAGTFLWDPVTGQGIVYDTFRGDLDALRATGLYTQDPALVPGARHFCALGTPTLVDGDLPDPGQVFFYVVGATGVVEGTLGFTSAAMERTRRMTCTPGD